MLTVAMVGACVRKQGKRHKAPDFLAKLGGQHSGDLSLMSLYLDRVD